MYPQNLLCPPIFCCAHKICLNIPQVVDDVQNKNRHKKENLNFLDPLVEEHPGLRELEGLNQVQRGSSGSPAYNLQ